MRSFIKLIDFKIVAKTILLVISAITLYQSYHCLVELYNKDFFNHLLNPSQSIMYTQSYDFALISELTALYRKDLNGLILSLCICLSTSLIFVFLRFRNTEKFLWTVSWILTFTFAFSIFVLCWVAIQYASNHDVRKIIGSKADLNDFTREAQFQSEHKPNDQKPIFIKTGLFIQSLQFNSANDIVATFYVWQKYEHDKHDTSKINIGFVLPEAVTVNATQAYKKRYKDFTIYGWDVEATIRETFNYKNYPFDFQNIWIRMWHKDFEKNIILIPDLDAYRSLKPQSRMGIEAQIVLPGWEITESFFGYMYNDYNTNFGMPDYIGLDNFPELYYCILVKRFVLTTFISELLPILTILFILFICAVIAHDESLDDFFKFNVMELLSLVAAMVFVIILLQVDLRRKISDSDILYLEYYYFMLYIMIFGILLNYIMLNQFKKFRIIQYKDNIIIKVSLLPFGLGFILYITYLTFL